MDREAAPEQLGGTGGAGRHVARDENYYHRVYALVRKIPRGQVATYGQLAVMLGSPAAARATGYALNALDGRDNEIPWWRVVNAKGEVSPRSGGGAELQRQLLSEEGVYDGTAVNLRQCRWDGWGALELSDSP